MHYRHDGVACRWLQDTAGKTGWQPRLNVYHEQSAPPLATISLHVMLFNTVTECIGFFVCFHFLLYIFLRFTTAVCQLLTKERHHMISLISSFVSLLENLHNNQNIKLCHLRRSEEMGKGKSNQLVQCCFEKIFPNFILTLIQTSLS